MCSMLVPLEKGYFETGKVYQTETFDIDPGPGKHGATLRIGVFKSEGGYEVHWEVNDRTGLRAGSSSDLDIYQAKWEFWRILNNLPAGTEVYEVWTNGDRVRSETPGKENGEKSVSPHEDFAQPNQKARSETTAPERESDKENLALGSDPNAEESKTPDERGTQTGPESEDSFRELIEGLNMAGMGAGLIPVAGDWISLGISGAILLDLIGNKTCDSIPLVCTS